MPPIGRDDQTHALHLLNVIAAAKQLVSALSKAGGPENPRALLDHEEVKLALRVIFDATSKLQVYETRARARGTLDTFTDEQLAEVIKNVRAAKILSAGEQNILESTPEEDADAFSLGAEQKAAPEETPPPSGDKDSDDAFSL